MSGPLTSASAAFVAKNSRIPPYAIEQSLRFDGSSKLERTNSDNGASRSFTLSYWIKKTYLGDNNNSIVGSSDGSSNWSYISYGESSSDPDQLMARSNGSNSGYSNGYVFNATRKHRDPSAWQHHFLVVDKTAGTSKGYINGVLDDGGTYGGTRSSNGWTLNGTTATVRIGTHSELGNTNYLNGYLADWYFVDGTAMDVTDFGGFDDYGVWRPIEPTISSYGTNGYYLKFDSTAANGVGHDHSGNGNNWTASGFTTSGPGTDVMSDTPTTNWCTLNPLNTDNVSTFSNGNLDTVCNNASTSGGTIAVNSGKWYAEFVCTAKTATNAMAGVCTIDGFDGERQPNESQNGGSGTIYVMNGDYIQSGSAQSYGATWAVNDIIGTALDLDSAQNTVTFYKNGASQGAINISNADYVFAVGNGQASSTVTYTSNFGQREFAHPPGTASATDYFNTVTYTGTGATQSITGVGFQADLVWIKHRNGTGNHNLFDSVRGTGKQLYPNLADGEGDFATSGLTAFGTDGFTLGNSVNSDANINNNTYVAWCWKAGGTASSNTDGTITSSVSANQDAGFSIVQFDGTGANGSIGHGLGVAPSFIMAKSKTHTDNWFVYHSTIGANGYIMLNQTSAADTPNSTVWQNVSPTSTVFYASTGGYNDSGQTIMAYCFAEKTGVSKFGTYEGTSAANSIDVGFKPALVIIKNIDASSQWMMVDTERGSHQILNPNRNVAEFTSSSSIRVNLTSSGFILDGNGTDTNVSGNTYIYAAFAENFSADATYKALNTDNLPAPDIKDGSDYFASIVGPGDTETAWSETNTAVSVSGGQLTTYDGLSNTEYLLGRTDTKYPPIDFIRTLREIELDGHDDWYLGSQYEMEVIYYNLKPTTDNNTTVSSGQNNSYSVPQRTTTNYTASDPSQTSVTAFQSGGAQALDSETSTAFVYYTSSAASTNASNGKSFTATGVAAGYNYQSGQKYSEIGITRAIRRVAYTGSEPSLGAAYGGGYYAGLYSLNGDGTATHALIVSDKSNGENTGMKALVQQKFSSGLYWIKDRQASDEHKLIDSVRGLTNQLSSNLSAGETTYSDPDNASVAWTWLAGGSGSSNTDGTITSTVSASPSSGFSIGTFTGTGAVGSIGHGLGVAPKFILIKRTNVDGNSWAVYHDSVGSGKQLLLNSTSAASNDTNGFPSAPTSSVINVGTGAQMDTNQVGAHVFYAWSEVPGFSKFGVYTGNGNADGPFIYTGFEVRWLMWKKSSSSSHWVIWDTERHPYNVMDSVLFASNTGAEQTNAAYNYDLLSNGFKVRTGSATINDSGATYIYAAFAEHPFGGSGVNPATAR